MEIMSRLSMRKKMVQFLLAAKMFQLAVDILIVGFVAWAILTSIFWVSKKLKRGGN